MPSFEHSVLDFPVELEELIVSFASACFCAGIVGVGQHILESAVSTPKLCEVQ